MTDDVVAMDRQELQDLLLHSDDISAFLEDFTAMLAREISDGDAPAWCAVTLLRKRKASTAAASGLFLAGPPRPRTPGHFLFVQKVTKNTLRGQVAP